MKTILAVGAGGAIGASARYLLTQAVMRVAPGGFPYGTLLVNVLGSMTLGLLAGVFALRFSPSHPLPAFLVTGILGGFTTFSAFSLDVVTLVERGAFGLAFAYAMLSVILAVGGLFAGLSLARGVFA